MLAAMTVSAQRSMTHRVQRGETPASIARKYGMTEDELYRRNPNVRNYYAGTFVNVVDYYDDGGSSYGSSALSSSSANPDLVEAQNYERTGDYKKAINSYSRVIKSSPSACNYFSRGVCYYQTKKWKKAISDFEYVIDAPDCSRKMRRECARYLDDAYEQAAIAKEKRTNVLAGILAGVVAVGVVADAVSSHGKKNDKGKPPHRGGKGDAKPGRAAMPSLVAVPPSRQEQVASLAAVTEPLATAANLVASVRRAAAVLTEARAVSVPAMPKDSLPLPSASKEEKRKKGSDST